MVLAQELFLSNCVSGLQCTAQLRSKGSEIDLDKINSEHQRRPRGACKSESEDLRLQHGPINSNNSSRQRLLGVSIISANKTKDIEYWTAHSIQICVRPYQLMIKGD